MSDAKQRPTPTPDTKPAQPDRRRTSGPIKGPQRTGNNTDGDRHCRAAARSKPAIAATAAADR